MGTLDRFFVMGGRLKRRLKSYDYSRKHARYAAEKLHQLELDNGPLDSRTVRMCRDYAVDVLGGRQYEPWLHVYSQIAGGFKEGWIPANFYRERVIPHSQGQYESLGDMRVLCVALFGDEFLEDVASVANGMFVDRDRRAIPDGKLHDVIFSRGDRVVFKLNSSLMGAGIHVFDRAGFEPGKVRGLGNGTFQAFIRQHEDFDRFATESVATLRFTTTTDDSGKATVRSAILRVGRTEDTFIKMGSQIKIPLDLATGELQERGFLPTWRMTRTHPDTGVTFKGQRVPHYQDCVDVAVRCHQTVPFIRCIGWDLTVDRAGKVKILEWNTGHNDIKLPEAAHGPCFTDLHWERYRPQAPVRAGNMS